MGKKDSEGQSKIMDFIMRWKVDHGAFGIQWNLDFADDMDLPMIPEQTHSHLRVWCGSYWPPDQCQQKQSATSLLYPCECPSPCWLAATWRSWWIHLLGEHQKWPLVAQIRILPTSWRKLPCPCIACNWFGHLSPWCCRPRSTFSIAIHLCVWNLAFNSVTQQPHQQWEAFCRTGTRLLADTVAKCWLQLAGHTLWQTPGHGTSQGETETRLTRADVVKNIHFL